MAGQDYAIFDYEFYGTLGGYPIVNFNEFVGGKPKFEYLTTNEEGNFIVLSGSGVNYGADVTVDNVNKIMQCLSNHYEVAVIDNGPADYASASDINVANVGQIWLGEGTAPAITALSLDNMGDELVQVSVNAVVGSLANVLCLVNKVNDNTVHVDVCMGADSNGCYVWDGSQNRFLPDATVDTSALSSAIASALYESEGRDININSVGTDESYIQARPTNYIGAAQPVDLPFTVVVNDGNLCGQYLGVVKPLVFNGRINNPVSDYVCIAKATQNGASIELISNDNYSDCSEIEGQDFDSVITCLSRSVSPDEGYVVTAYNDTCTIETAIESIDATLSVKFGNREICKIANCGNSGTPFVSYS